MSKSIWSRIAGLSEEILNQTEKVEVKQKVSAGSGSASMPEAGRPSATDGKKEKERVEKKKKAEGKEKFLLQPEIDENWLAEQNEGQLTVDVYEEEPNLVIKSTLAGVDPKDIDLTVEKDLITIRGQRIKEKEALNKKYFYQECFWGKFSRTIILPYEINPDKVKADLKNGILTIVLLKIEKKEEKTKLR